MTVYLGETVRLSAAFTNDSDVATDPDSGTITITIYDPYHAVQVTTASGTKRSGTTATYDYYYDVSATAVSGNWTYIYKATTTVDSQELDTVEGKDFLVKDPLVP